MARSPASTPNDVYRHAEATGKQLTLGLVERRLDELRGHETSCPYGLCTAAAGAGTAGVWHALAGPTGSRRPDGALLR